MKSWQIWQEGYTEQGMDGRAAQAILLATVEAETFDDAVEQYITEQQKKYPTIRSIYGKGLRWVKCNVSQEHPLGRKEVMVYWIWNCGLHDNERDARKAFG
jgi:hypothetical protein